MKIHISRNGKILGVYDLETVNEYLDNGNLRKTDLSWISGYREWIKLDDLLENLNEPEELDEAIEPVVSSTNNSSPDDNIIQRVEQIEKDLLRIKKLYEETLSFHKSHPAIALSQARKSAEAICKKIYINENLAQSGKPVDKLMLNDLICSLNRSQIIPKHISIALNTIQHYGNFGTHDQGEDENITEKFTQPALYALNEVVDWFLNIYFKSGIPICNIDQIDNEELKFVPKGRSPLWESLYAKVENNDIENKSDEDILNNFFNGVYNTPDEILESNIKNLQKIFSYMHIQPVFKKNDKYSEQLTNGAGMICYADLFKNNYVIRRGSFSNFQYEVDENSEIIASYESIEQMINDGWRLD